MELKSDHSGTCHSTPRCSTLSGTLAVHVSPIVGLNTGRYMLGVKDRALEVLGTLQGNEEEGPMMGEDIGLNE